MICGLYSSWKETPSKFQVSLVTQSESHSPSESPTTQFSVSLPADGNGAVRTPTCPYNTVGSVTPEPAPSATSGDGTASPRALPRPDGQPETGEGIELTPRWKWWLQVPASPKTGPGLLHSPLDAPHVRASPARGNPARSCGRCAERPPLGPGPSGWLRCRS